MSADNIKTLPQRGLGQHAKALLSRIEFAGDLAPVLERPYVIKDWLDRGAVSVVYGDANVGKSFWAVDVAHHVHQGKDWGGYRVHGGPVLYIAAEGGALFNNRLSARNAKFAVLRGPVRLNGRNNVSVALGETIQHLAEVHGDFALIIVDTLARVMGEADENTAEAMSMLMANMDHLAQLTGAHIMLIHHSGKDSTRGARGHSSLRAAVDTEIELTEKDGVRLARTTKQRDMEGGKELPFSLEVVTLGRDQDGDPVTSCIVKHKGGRANPMR